MSFIDSTYFIGEINIPGSADETSLAQAIPQYEKEILIKLLGYKLYSLLQADLVAGVPQTQKYIDLVDGKEFTHAYNGYSYTIKWEGLQNTIKQSLISYYIFYKFVERDVTRLYGTGIMKATVKEGWENVSPENKLINAWERMRELYGKMPPEYKYVFGSQIVGSDLPDVFNAEPSAYNFLFTNRTNYPDWIFTPIWNINKFGI